MKIQLFLLSILFCIISCESPTEKAALEKPLLSKEEMLEDFDIFQSIFERANAGLYKYRSKSAVDSLFSISKKSINESTSYRDFFNILWEVIDYTGSCHNGLAYPDSLDSVLNEKSIFFPIPLKYLNDKLYINLSYESIPVGSELLTVNDMEANKFATFIASYISTDGFNTTGKYANIESDWLPFYVYLAWGEQEAFHLTYKNYNTNEIEEINVASVTYSDFYKHFKNRFTKAFEERKEKEYTYSYLDSIDTGLLEVSTFGMGDAESEEHKMYAAFLDSVFLHLKNKRVRNLIVDIRGNGGGDDPNDLLLFSYLTKRNFRENNSAFTLFQEIPFPQYYIDDDIETLPIELKEEHSVFKNGKYFQDATYNKIWEPN